MCFLLDFACFALLYFALIALIALIALLYFALLAFPPAPRYNHPRHPVVWAGCGLAACSAGHRTAGDAPPSHRDNHIALEHPQDEQRAVIFLRCELPRAVPFACQYQFMLASCLTTSLPCLVVTGRAAQQDQAYSHHRGE